LSHVFRRLAKSKEKLLRDAAAREFMIAAENEATIKRIGNLCIVGRSQDAEALMTKEFGRLIEHWKEDGKNPFYMHLMAKTALFSGILEPAAKILEMTIKKLSCEIDMTLIYLDLGMLYRAMGRSSEEQLKCFREAINAVAPKGGKHVASRREKSEAHYQAYKAAVSLQQLELAHWHLGQAEEFAGGVKLEYEFAANDFFEDRTLYPTPEIMQRVTACMEKFKVFD